MGCAVPVQCITKPPSTLHSQLLEKHNLSRGQKLLRPTLSKAQKEEVLSICSLVCLILKPECIKEKGIIHIRLKVSS